MSVGLSLSSGTASPDTAVVATVQVSARRSDALNTVVRLTASNASASLNGSGALGTVTSGGRTISGAINIPSNAVAGRVTVTAVVTADRVSGIRQASRTISIVLPGTPAAAGALAPTLPFANAGYVPPAMNQQVGLPLIQSPDIAPDQIPVVHSVALRGTQSERGLGMVASVHAMWVASLLGGISLMNVRLQRNRWMQTAGNHRRTRTPRRRPTA